MVSWLEQMIMAWRDAGVPLIFLWLLTLAVAYGILSHVSLPKSKGARSIISIVIAFLVLFATSGQIISFLAEAVAGFVVVGFMLLIAVILLEMTGVKVGENTIFKHHPKFFGGIILAIVVLIFVSAGGLNLLGWNYSLSADVFSMLLFFAVIVITMWALLKEEKS